jgi:hypothetical protein
MNGGEQLGRHLSLLDSGATGEEEKEGYHMETKHENNAGVHKSQVPGHPSS